MLKFVHFVELNLNKNKSIKSDGWNWSSFIFGPFWYLSKGLHIKGLILLLISIISIGFGIPIIWFYCGLRGNSDLYEKILKSKSRIDFDKI